MYNIIGAKNKIKCWSAHAPVATNLHSTHVSIAQSQWGELGLPSSDMVILLWVGGGRSYSELEVVAGGVPWLFPFCAAQQVLDEFQDQFIENMDSNAVVQDLLHYDIITEGEQSTITMTMDRTQQNKFLHLYLRKCSEDAFHRVCDIISGVKGNPRMSTLGIAMKRRLETGNCVCACMRACVIW